MAHADCNSSIVKAPEADPTTGVRPSSYRASARRNTPPGLVDLCATCSVVVECLQAAIAEGDRYDV